MVKEAGSAHQTDCSSFSIISGTQGPLPDILQYREFIVQYTGSETTQFC